MCDHKNFTADAQVKRYIHLNEEEEEAEITFKVEITINCTDCFKPFKWIGLPRGYNNPKYPTIMAHDTTLSAPIKPII